MKSLMLLLLFLGIFSGYLLYTPIPDDLVDPHHFRLFIAGMKAGVILSNLRTFFQPGDDIYAQTLRFLSEVALPEPDVQGKGSNITARYTMFDGVRVLLYEPINRNKELLPGLIYFHGGGLALGSAKLHDPLSRKFAEELKMVVISVDYRLAPENLFPAQFDDCLSATKYFLKNAHKYHVDPYRIAMGGDSAGGLLTAATVQTIHDDPSVPNVKLQVHFYPWLQSLDLNTPSYQRYENLIGDLGCTKRSVADFASAAYFGKRDPHLIGHMLKNTHTSAAFARSARYRKVLSHDIIFQKLKPSQSMSFTSSSSSSSSSLSSVAPSCPFASFQPRPYRPQEEFEEGNDTLWKEVQEFFTDLRMLPLFRENLTGLPKAFIATCDWDALRDDGILYAHILEKAGVEVTWKNYPGAWHAIVAAGPIKDIPMGVTILQDAVDFVKKNI